MEYAIASETIAPGSRAALNIRLQSALKHQQVTRTVDALFPNAKHVKGCGVRILRLVVGTLVSARLSRAAQRSCGWGLAEDRVELSKENSNPDSVVESRTQIRVKSREY